MATPSSWWVLAVRVRCEPGAMLRGPFLHHAKRVQVIYGVHPSTRSPPV
jgi:hypothetical protein